MGSIGAPELIIVGIIVVLLFGATRLPATAKGLGQALRMFKKEINDDDNKPKAEVPAAPQQPLQQQAPIQYQQSPVAQPPAAQTMTTPQSVVQPADNHDATASGSQG